MCGISKDEFIRLYSRNLLEGSGALFIGAGMSIPAGFVDWRRLLAEIATDLGLDIELEHDLIAVAQFEANRRGHKGRLADAIIRQFDKDAKLTQSHSRLARLPVDTVWTTNYDQLLEQAYSLANKRVDVKYTAEQLVIRKPYSDLVLFKMHGDVDFPSDAVLTKDDYESYESERAPFTHQLLADLVSKQFLFLGFSFTDPNIEYTFSRLRRLLNPRRKLNGVGKEHYCVLRRPHVDDYEGTGHSLGEVKKRAKADTSRFNHRIDDLRRYGVSTIVVEKYTEIPGILLTLHRRVSTRSVLISGAAHDYGPRGRDKIEGLCEDLGRRLIEEGYDIVSGVGKGIGASVMMGAHQALARPESTRLGQRLKLFPFPYWHTDETKRKSFGEANRVEMAAQAGASIFICGNKLDPAKGLIESPGVFKEFENAEKNGHVMIPIGATGHAALKLWDKVKSDTGHYFPGMEVDAELAVLGDQSRNNSQLIDAALAILSKAGKA